MDQPQTGLKVLSFPVWQLVSGNLIYSKVVWSCVQHKCKLQLMINLQIILTIDRFIHKMSESERYPSQFPRTQSDVFT